MIKFNVKHYDQYRIRFLTWYLVTLAACGLSVYYLWSPGQSTQSSLIQAPILIWFASFSFIFYMIYHTEKHARYLANFSRYFLIMKPQSDGKYVYYIEGPGYRQIVMTKDKATNEVHVVSSQYTPIFPKLFYTHLIRDLHQFANEATIDITNVDSVQIKMHKEVSTCAVQ